MKKKQTRKFTRFGRIGWKKNWRSYEDAKKFVHSLNLKKKEEWEKYSISGKKPKDIPSAPWRVYKKEWNGWGDWLGTGSIATFNKEFWSFEKAREFARNLELKSYMEWVAYRKSGKLPDYIPQNPSRTYKNKGWISYGDWLGTGTIAPQIKSANFSPWPEAKQKMRKLGEEYGLKGFDDWRKFAKTHKKLLAKLNLPVNPWMIYTKEKVWKRIR
jgi:hypothetical protein